jgi:arylsulfatase
MIVRWPNGLKDAGKLRHDPCHFVDVLPTLVDLAGGGTASAGGPPMAGRSFAPALRRDGAAPREFLYFNHNNNRALRAGDWKLISTGVNGPWELYDLSQDRCEQHDLAAAQPGRVQKLAAMWTAHDTEYARVREISPPSTRIRLGNASGGAPRVSDNGFR